MCDEAASNEASPVRPSALRIDTGYFNRSRSLRFSGAGCWSGGCCRTVVDFWCRIVERWYRCRIDGLNGGPIDLCAKAGVWQWHATGRAGVGKLATSTAELLVTTLAPISASEGPGSITTRVAIATHSVTAHHAIADIASSVPAFMTTAPSLCIRISGLNCKAGERDEDTSERDDFHCGAFYKRSLADSHSNSSGGILPKAFCRYKPLFLSRLLFRSLIVQRSASF